MTTTPTTLSTLSIVLHHFGWDGVRVVDSLNYLGTYLIYYYLSSHCVEGDPVSKEATLDWPAVVKYY